MRGSNVSTVRRRHSRNDTVGAEAKHLEQLEPSPHKAFGVVCLLDWPLILAVWKSINRFCPDVSFER
jgi:hypothetical protein